MAFLYCNKCGWVCGEIASLLDKKPKMNKNHKCKPPPTKEKQKEFNKDFPPYISVK